MTVSLLAGWDHGRVGTATVSVTDSGGTFDVSITSGVYSHLEMNLFDGSQYAVFADDLETAINAASTPGGYTVAVSDDPIGYTISGPSHSLAFNPADDAELLMRRILGFTGNETAATSHTSDATPWYVIEPAHGGRSNDSLKYRAAGKTVGGHTQGGRSFAVTASDPIWFWDWELMFETLAATFADEATSAVPFTFELLFEHVAGHEAFGWYDSATGTGTVHRFRPEGADFTNRNRRLDQPDFHDYWHIRFRTFYVGNSVET